MRLRYVLLFLLLATNVAAAERWILIAGSTTGVPPFRTDARILNPSFEKNITITATLYPTGNVVDGAVATGNASTKTFTVTKRQMLVLNDVNNALFGTGTLGAIQFRSDDEFEVTSRIFATTAVGTLGQFGPGLALTSAKNKGALLQLRSTGSPFRTNIGVVNPQDVETTVRWVLYNASNAIIAGKTIKLAPHATIGPTNMSGSLYFDVGSNDISDAWVSFTADKPIFAYASVVDGGTTDQTFVPAVDDAGVAPGEPPPPPQSATKQFNVRLRDFLITITPPLAELDKGDKVEFTIVNEGAHGFELVAPDGAVLIDELGLPLNSPVKRSFTATKNGTYFYFCTNSNCGDGHGRMSGDFSVGEDAPGTGGIYSTTSVRH